jgi:hypothetical protein
MPSTTSCTPPPLGWHISCWIGEEIDQGQTEEYVTRRRAKWPELGSGDDLGLPRNRNKHDRVAKNWMVLVPRWPKNKFVAKRKARRTF